MKIIISEKAVLRANCCKYLKMALVISGLLLANLAQAENCLLEKQLKDPYIRAEYEEIVAAYRTNVKNSDVENMYDDIQSASFSEESNFAGGRINPNLDPISKECIACHDGFLAKEARYRISGGHQKQSTNFDTVLGAHPVGMDYDQYRWNKHYVPTESFPTDMVLMDGKVTCVTCHNLLGNYKKYLVVDSDKSELCLSCHIK